MSTTPNTFNIKMPAIQQEGHPARPILTMKDDSPNYRHQSWQRWLRAHRRYTQNDRRTCS